MLFSTLSNYYEKLEATSKRLELVDILSRLFKESDASEIGKICYLIQGRVAPFYEPVEMGMSENLVAVAVGRAFGKSKEEVIKLYRHKGNMGLAAAELAARGPVTTFPPASARSKLKKDVKGKNNVNLRAVGNPSSRATPRDLSVSDVFEELLKVARFSGEGTVEKKVSTLAELLKKLDPTSVKHVVNIPLGTLRLGVGDPTVMDALSLAKTGDKKLRPVIEDAYNKTSDLGYVGELFFKHGEKGLADVKLIVGKPVRPALAERMPNADEVVKRMGDKFAAEPKFDGFRCISGYSPIYVEYKGIVSARDVRVGDMVLTHRGNFKRIIAKNKRVIDKGENLFELQSCLGSSLKITQGHPVLIHRAGRDRWTNIEDIRKGDWLVFPVPVLKSNVRVPNPYLMLANSSGYVKRIEMNGDMYQFLGFWVGDGFTNDFHNTQGIGLTFNARTERHLADRYTKFIRDSLGVDNISNYTHNGGLSVYFRDEPLKNWLSVNFRREWKGKMVPEWFVDISKKDFESFLNGWIESDGTLRHGGGYKITTKEGDLASAVQLMALRLGIALGLRRIRVAGKTYFEVIVPGTNRDMVFEEDRWKVRILRCQEIKGRDSRTVVYNFQVRGDESYCLPLVSLHNCQIHLDRGKSLMVNGSLGAGSISAGRLARPKSSQWRSSDISEPVNLKADIASFQNDKHKNPHELFTINHNHHVRIFSRNLEDMTHSFPDLAEGVLKEVKAESAILEGEAIAYNPQTEEFLPFQETTKRRRKYKIEETAKALPLVCFTFDILYLDGKDITTKTEVERRKLLEHVVSKNNQVIRIAEQRVISTAKQIHEFFNEAISDGLEGLMIKKLDSPYKAGGRGFHWIKFKRASSGELTDTVDCVLLGIFTGRGKRTEFGVGGLLVGIYNNKTDEFETISRVGTGLTDEEFRKVNEIGKKLRVRHKPARVKSKIEPSYWVEPEEVLEIYADEITKSPIHTAGWDEKTGTGFALRFPRLVKFREADKRPEDSTTVNEIRKLYEMQYGKK